MSMDDSCAVCAETLELVAYGPCGHREVCSMCIVRLRFICNDRRCCICKAESDVVFVTKALGDYTRMISDFSVLPSEPRGGKVGSYYYHEDTQAFFDDVDHYKMVKDMCRLSCNVCDNMDGQSSNGPKRHRNIEQLKGHLFHQHKLLMCSLCLEGRKVFICEQKLYTRTQLNQHINTGDSEVDGSESDRGGFMGHPMCEFCRTPFYGDNELYTHMSTEHYTCHICQRQHPGQYDYYKNYDDLEIHFRREHFLCEDEACLAKKFVVFQFEQEMKRHNAQDHGGKMSRSQRNAALQIPTSFRFKRSNEQDNRRGRGRSFFGETSQNQLSMAVQASLEMANAASSFHDPSSSNSQVAHDNGNIDNVGMATTDSEAQIRYLQATSNSRPVSLEASSFPPLPRVSKQPHHGSRLKNTLADRLRGQMTAQPSLSSKKKKNRGSSSSTQSNPMINNPPSSSSNSVQITPVMRSGPSSATSQSSSAINLGPSLKSSALSKPMKNKSLLSASSSIQMNPAISNGPSTSGSAISAPVWPAISQGLTSASSSSSPAPKVLESKTFDSQFPPVSSVTQTHKPSTTIQPSVNVKDVHTANKSLVEKMRAALNFDEEKYNEFKEISGEYRKGSIHPAEYLVYVEQFGLSDLILDLARLCPNSQKQKELLDTYNTNMRSNGLFQNGRKDSSSSLKKGKEKRLASEANNSKSSLADTVINSVRELQLSYKPSEVEAEELSKDGYRAATKGKSVVIEQVRGELGSANHQSKAKEKGDDKHRKKTSKFHRVRLGEGSAEAYLNAAGPDLDPLPIQDSGQGLPVRGVWGRGGGQKLISNKPKNVRI